MMKIHPLGLTVIMVLSLLFGYVIGTDMGIANASILGAKQACENQRITLLDCTKFK